MTALQIHPEDLLDRAKHGGLAVDQERLLQTHLDTCAACRFELSLTPALYQSVQLGSHDHALIARAVANVSRAPRYERVGGRLGPRTVSALTLALALLAGVVVASGSAYLWRQRNPPAAMDAPAAGDPGGEVTTR